jgi:hypothetical protein
MIADTTSADRRSQEAALPELEWIEPYKFALEVGVTTRTLRRWVRKGLDGIKLKACRRGGRVFFRRLDYQVFEDRLAAAKNRPIGHTRAQVHHDEAIDDARLEAAGLKFQK